MNKTMVNRVSVDCSVFEITPFMNETMKWKGYFSLSKRNQEFFLSFINEYGVCCIDDFRKLNMYKLHRLRHLGSKTAHAIRIFLVENNVWIDGSKTIQELKKKYDNALFAFDKAKKVKEKYRLEFESARRNWSVRNS